MTENLDHETIEGVFKATKDVVDALPDCTERRVAKAHLGQADDLAHQAQEKVKRPEVTEPLPASIEG